MSAEDKEASKKDLTSIVELSAIEMANDSTPHEEGSAAVEFTPPETVTDAEFQSLEELGDIAEPSNESILEEQPLDLGEQPLTATEPLEVGEPPIGAIDTPSGSPALENTDTTLNYEPIDAPPPGVEQSIKSHEPAASTTHDLGNIKAFGDKLAIGAARMEAVPAFSVLLTSKSNSFDEKTINSIRDVLTAEDYGIRFQDIAIQLEAGKLLVPQISEFAAVHLAQKLREIVDDIQLDLADEIYKGSSAELASPNDSFLLDAEHYDQHREEIHDIDAEPKSEQDVFTTTAPEPVQFHVTRILSAVTASEIISAQTAENTANSPEFEEAVDRLTRVLVTRAFKLGAHGVIGLSFTVRPIEASAEAAGDRARTYRLLASGTAIRGRRQ